MQLPNNAKCHLCEYLTQDYHEKIDECLMVNPADPWPMEIDGNPGTCEQFKEGSPTVICEHGYEKGDFCSDCVFWEEVDYQYDAWRDK